VSAHERCAVDRIKDSLALTPWLEAAYKDELPLVNALTTCSPRGVWTKKGGSKVLRANTVQRQQRHKNRRMPGISRIQILRWTRVSWGASQSHFNSFMSAHGVRMHAPY
jgi:hypothetical protein